MSADKRTRIFRSVAFRIFTIIIVIVLPVNLIVLFFAQMISRQSKQIMAAEIQNTLDMSAANLADDCSRVTKRLTFLSFSDADIEKLSLYTDEYYSSDKSRWMRSVLDTLKELRQEYSTVNYVYIRFPLNGNTVTGGSIGVGKEIYLDVVDQMLEEKGQFGTEWKVFSDGGKAFLISVGTWNNMHFGVILDLERTLNQMNFPEYEGNRKIFFANEEETIFSQGGDDFFEKTGKNLDELRESKAFIVYTSQLEGYNLKLVEVVEHAGLFATLPEALRILEFVAIVLAVIAVPCLLISTNRWVTRPLRRLTRAMHLVEAGDLSYRIPERNSTNEFEFINHNFNTMLEQVEKLKIDVYEKEIEKQNITMEYLSHQVQPHFILNIMNILYSYEPEEYELSRKMIMCISKYFRHIVKVNSRFVTLQQEMEHIRNYFEIQKARYQGRFSYIVEYEEGLRCAQIPPLLVQNFAENSIKYSLRAREETFILVITEYCRREEELKLRIRIADTGKGMSDEILEEIRIFQETDVHQEHLGVGIQNAILRLKYIYGESTAIRFWRDEHYPGTNIEIILPIYLEEENMS